MNKNYQFYMKADVSQYTGQWVAVCNQQIVAHGADIKEVLKQAKIKYPKEKPLITRVPDKETMIF